MKAYYLNDIKKILRRSVVAVGVFDGVHIGHRHILKALVKRAKVLKAESVVLTFFPHPSSILHAKRPSPLLMSLDHRIRILEEAGIDITVIVKFTKGFSRINPETFVLKMLLGKLGMKELLVGDKFTLGSMRRGNIKFLEGMAKAHGFKLIKVGLLKAKTRRVSSTYIRSLIARGKIKTASRLLARPVSILGTVKRGARRGRILGFPTANIDPHHEAIPPSGVYAVYVIYNNRRHKGLLNIGFRPTFYHGDLPPEPTIEVHLFDFDKDIYREDIEILFVKKLRPEKRFKKRLGLIRRIILDKRLAANHL